MRMRKLVLFAVAFIVMAIPAYSFAGEVKVSVNVGDHGSVNDHSEDYSEKVEEGSSYVLKIRAEDGYEIHTVLINDESVSDLIADPVEGQTEAEITLGDVGSDVDISVVFRAATEEGSIELEEEGDEESGSGDDENGDDKSGAGDDEEGDDKSGSGESEDDKNDKSRTADYVDKNNNENTSESGNGDDKDTKEDEANRITDTGTDDEVDGGAEGDTNMTGADEGEEAKVDDTDAVTIPEQADVGDRENYSPKTGDETLPLHVIVMSMFWTVVMAVSMMLFRRRS